MSVEVYDFRSDNVGGIAPELLAALLERYDADDRWLERALA